MSRQSELAALGRVSDTGALSNRNLIINGAMQVAQRGTSFTANGYGLDRWKTYNSGGTATLSQQTFASGSSPEVGLDTYVRIVRSSPSGIYYFSQRVEDVRKSDGATLTLSFYAKASSATTIPCRITQEFGAGGSAGVNITAQNSNVTTSWQKFSLTFNMASLSGKTVGTGSNFEPVFDIPATTATIEITGVQLEVGDTATEFEHRSYGDELARCMRYTNVYRADNQGVGAMIATGASTSAGNSYFLLTPQVPLRVKPSTSFSNLIVSNSLSFDAAVTTLSINWSNDRAFYVETAHTSSSAAEKPVNLRQASNSVGYLILDAEL